MESVDTGAPDTGCLEGAADAAEQDINGVESELQEQREQKKAEQKALAKYKVKVDGEELEVDENELKRSYAHAKAAAKRMEEAAEMRSKAIRKLCSLLRSNLASTLTTSPCAGPRNA